MGELKTEFKTEFKVGLLYISLHSQLEKQCGVGGIIGRKKFFEIIGKHYLIPKNLRDVVAKEMEKRNLVKIESKDSIIVLDSNFDLEKDVNKFYMAAGILQ